MGQESLSLWALKGGGKIQLFEYCKQNNAVLKRRDLTTESICRTSQSEEMLIVFNIPLHPAIKKNRMVQRNVKTEWNDL